MEKHEQLKAHVYQQLQSGLNPDEITAQLRSAGWDDAVIADTFKAVKSQITPPPAPAPAALEVIPPNSPVQQSATFQASGQKRGRIKTAWLLLKQSLKVLKTNKQLLKYPLMGTIISLLLTAVFAVIFFVGRDALTYTTTDVFGDSEIYLQGPGYIVGFVYYVLVFFAVFIYNAGLTAHVLDIFRGKSEGYKHYMKIAWSKKGAIFVYSLITATVGLILQAIEQRAQWLGWIMSRVLGVLWTLANLFTIPVIVETESSAPSAIKQSSKLFISRWGENIAARIAFGGILFLLYLLVFIPVMLVMYALLISAGIAGSAFVILMLILVIVMIVLFATIETAASNILSTALYYYARYSQIPAAFDADLLNAALIPKQKKRGLFGKKDTSAAN